MTVLQNTIGSILDNYADAIEGGNTYRGSGTKYRGIPGTYSNDSGIRSGDDTPLTATGATANTAFAVASTYSWDSNRWVKTEGPPMFALCTSATNAQNVGAARRVSAYDNSTQTFTFSGYVSWPANMSVDDVFAMREGFKRLPNNIDIEADDNEFTNGFDRTFKLTAMPGERLDWYGDGYQSFKTTLELRLRFLKYAREWDVVAAALENLSIIRSILTTNKYDLRGDYVVALIADKGNSPEVSKEDKDKVVVLDKYDLIYSYDATYL